MEVGWAHVGDDVPWIKGPNVNVGNHLQEAKGHAELVGSVLRQRGRLLHRVRGHAETMSAGNAEPEPSKKALPPGFREAKGRLASIVLAPCGPGCIFDLVRMTPMLHVGVAAPSA